MGGLLFHDGSMVLVYMLTWLGYIDGIHGAPYIAAPWIRHGIVFPTLQTMDLYNVRPPSYKLVYKPQ